MDYTEHFYNYGYVILTNQNPKHIIINYNSTIEKILSSEGPQLYYEKLNDNINLCRIENFVKKNKDWIEIEKITRNCLEKICKEEVVLFKVK